MDRYIIHSLIGNGPHSTVFRAELKDTTQPVVLKKIECHNQTEAIKALKELKEIQKLDHPNISVPQDVFIHWDENLSAVFMIIVTRLHDDGTLQRTVSEGMASDIAISETFMRVWLWQMIETLAYLESESVSHMNIKPSNIFVERTKTKVHLGDFVGATVLSESRTFKCRKSTDTRKYMPAEDVGMIFTAKIDMWAVGCILIELMSCHFLSCSDFESILLSIKETGETTKLQSIFQRVNGDYSQELIHLTKVMLNTDFESRSTALDMLGTDEFKDYITTQRLTKTEHELLRKKTSRHTEKVGGHHSPTEAIISEMKHKIEDITLLMDGINRLNQIDVKQCVFNNEMMEFIGLVIRTHKRNSDLQLACCILLAKLAWQARDGVFMFSKKLISSVSHAMKSSSKSSRLQIACATIFKFLSPNEEMAKEIGTVGGVQDTISALVRFSDDTEVCDVCCSALSTLSLYPTNAKIVSNETGLRIIMKTLEKHGSVAAVAESACAALWALSAEQTIIEKLPDQCPVYLVINCLVMHMTNVDVVGKALWALAGLIESDESCAYEVLFGDFSISGIATVIDAQKHHQNNEHIAEGFAKCITELCKYEDLCTEINSTNVRNILSELKLKFGTKTNIMLQIEKALEALGTCTASENDSKMTIRKNKDSSLIPTDSPTV